MRLHFVMWKTLLTNYAACIIATWIAETWLVATHLTCTCFKWPGFTVGYFGSFIDTDNLLSCSRYYTIGHFKCATHFGCFNIGVICMVCIINRWSHSILSSFEGEFWGITFVDFGHFFHYHSDCKAPEILSTAIFNSRSKCLCNVKQMLCKYLTNILNATVFVNTQIFYGGKWVGFYCVI